MESDEYERMNAAEDQMWWYRGLHANALAVYRRAMPPDAADGAPLLDAGCGTGGLLARLAGLPAGTRPVGLDVAPRAAELARAKSGRPVAVGSVNALPFRDASLGAMFSMDVLCHRAVDPAAALADAFRCLRPGGILVLNLPAYPWLFSVHDEKVHNARRFTRGQVRALLTAAGFRVARVSHWNMFLFPLMVLRRKLLPAGESDVQLYPAPVEAAFRAIVAAERGLLRLGLNLPFGGSILAVAIKP